MAERDSHAAAARPDLERLTALPSMPLVTLVVALAALVVFGQLPLRPHIFKVIEKLGHPGVFALIAAIALILLRKHAARRAAWMHYLLAFCASVALGGVTEIAQIFTHRHASLADVGLDARGAVAALALLAAFDARAWASRPRLTRPAYIGLACLIAIVVLMPLGRALAAYANRARNFPVLFTPTGLLDLYFLEYGAVSPTLSVDADRGDATRALRVPLIERPYAGVTLAEPSPDWRGYAALVVDATNPGPTALELSVRIDDVVQAHLYDDRYNGRFPIASGERRRIAISLTAIESAPHGRRTDMAHIAAIVLFRAGDGGPAAFLLNGVELEKHTD